MNAGEPTKHRSHKVPAFVEFPNPDVQNQNREKRNGQVNHHINCPVIYVVFDFSELVTVDCIVVFPLHLFPHLAFCLSNPLLLLLVLLEVLMVRVWVEIVNVVVDCIQVQESLSSLEMLEKRFEVGEIRKALNGAFGQPSVGVAQGRDYERRDQKESAEEKGNQNH